jgi:uncharacterized RDD family membrane protein YckC
MEPTDTNEGMDPGARREYVAPQVAAHELFTPPPPVVEPTLAEVNLRARALVVDMLVGLAMWLPLSLLLGGFSRSNGILRIQIGGVPFLCSVVLWMVYMTVMEGKYGASLGKRAKGLRVVSVDGSPLTLEASLIRNILRFLDAAPYVVPYLVGIMAANRSPLKQRFGDRVAETMVVVEPKALA